MAKTREELMAELAYHQERIAQIKAQLPKEGRKLTAAFCRDVKHTGGRGADRHTAGSGGYGLALVVKPTGAKSFIQRLTFAGKRTDIGLGPFPLLSLEQARDAAFENRRIVRGGGGFADLVRPGGAPAPRAKPRKAAGVPSLAEAAAIVIGIQEKGWRGKRTREGWESSLRRYAFPALGDLPVSHVGAPEILKVIGPLWGTKRRQMDDLLNRLSVVCKWAMAQGFRGDDPTAAVRATLPRNGKTRRHFDALPHAAVADALSAVRKDTGAASLALRLCILTATRSGEARGAMWSEVDLEAKTWTIPGERMKAGAEHVVPLSGQALAILEEAKALGGEPLVFPAPRGGELWDSSLRRVLKDARVGGTVHGMRSAFRDWCAETDVAQHLAETALAHTVGGVEGAYLRTRRIEERRALMQQWADYLQPKGEKR